MSCDIREYESADKEGYPGGNRMTLTATVGPEGDRFRIQFTIGQEYCIMSQNAIADLIDVIVKRIWLFDGYNATGNERDNILFKEYK